MNLENCANGRAERKYVDMKIDRTIHRLRLLTGVALVAAVVSGLVIKLAFGDVANVELFQVGFASVGALVAHLTHLS